jgi:hypothetical protein
MNLSTAVELKKIELNNYTRYIDVFLGEGQSLMHFSPNIPCILNDPNTDLINFYKYINEPSLKEELAAFAENWELIGKFSSLCNAEILMAYQDLSTEIISTEDVGFMIRAIVMMNMNHEEFSPLFEQKFVVSIDMFTNGLIKPIVNALLKLKGDTAAENFKQDIETAFRSGFYEHFKNLINWQKTDLIDCISLSKHFASWLFIKEFGKSHHLHYDQNGNLKTHYGGEDYNRKSFHSKLEQISNPAFITKIKNAKLFNTNPIDFIQEVCVTNSDLVLINLTDANLVMAIGKNYTGFSNQLAQIKQIVKLNLNFLIIINDLDIATELVEFSEGNLRITEYPEGYYLSTFAN